MMWFGKKSVARQRPDIPGAPIIAPTIPPDWTTADVSALRGFFNTATGGKLLQRGRAMEYSMAVTACGDSMHTVHSAARAAGISDTLNWLESLASDKMLSRLTGAQVRNLNPATSDQDDAELAERYSP
jgi:hypothetical protein